MADVELYVWEPVRAFHAVWLQQLEQGCVTWADKEVMLKYRGAFKWHHVAAPFQPALAPSQQSLQSQRKQQRRAQLFNIPAKPGSKACVGYNKGTCSDPTSPPKELYVCAYCITNVRRISYHPEQFC